jgi:hypothetical protein
MKICVSEHLPHVGFRVAEYQTTFGYITPIHLHFDYELPPVIVDTFRIDKGVYPQWIVGYLFGREVFDAFDQVVGRQRHQCIEETDEQVGMFAEYPLKGQIIFRIKIACHNGNKDTVSFSFHQLISMKRPERR